MFSYSFRELTIQIEISSTLGSATTVVKYIGPFEYLNTLKPLPSLLSFQHSNLWGQNTQERFNFSLPFIPSGTGA